MTTPQDQDVAPLTLGHGLAELEAFLDSTCPHSKRAFGKLQPLLDLVGADNLTIRIRFVCQPWHLFSGIVTRAILAASATEGGKNTALKAMAGVYANRDDFEFEHHHSGPNMDRTPNQILRDISELAGTDLSEAWKLKSVDQALRWHTKYSRQNGVHVSPTFAVDRIVVPSMGSRQTIEEWREHLGV
ncbi:MAG: thioredoxin [Hyphomicrobiales bacterium]|nr:thioredoxin [Hyphomicrobiales bacterium]